MPQSRDYELNVVSPLESLTLEILREIPILRINGTRVRSRHGDNDASVPSANER